MGYVPFNGVRARGRLGVVLGRDESRLFVIDGSWLQDNASNGCERAHWPVG